jgi:diguanylate cyclase (GGDEF)-like protein
MPEIRRASQWEIQLSKSFGFLHLRSLRDRIVAFAVFAALVPSVATAILAYTQNRRALDTRLTEELRTSGTQGAREVSLWYQQRVFDLKVFASSYEITENVTRRDAGPRVRAYLESVMERVDHLAALVVVDARGQVLASAPDSPTQVALPDGWLVDVRSGKDVVGFAADAGGDGSIILAVPIFRQGSGTVVAALVARLQLAGLAAQLATLAPAEGALSLLAAGGTVILRAVNDTGLASAGAPPAEQLDALRADSAVRAFVNGLGAPAFGMLRTVPGPAWVALAEISQARAFAQARRLRNTTALIMLGILVGVGWIAYRLGLLIVRPLDRLAVGAEEVAGGNLDVDLPVVGSGEVAYLTEVFNDMVKRLREGRAQLSAANTALQQKNEELERLSVTDQLTGLYNRRRMLEVLEGEVQRSRRLAHQFCVLMMDVDHFKKFNDSFGHQAGDRVLAGVADVLRETTREIDTPARYGGEEFLVVLPEAGLDAAVEVAERIRSTLASRIFEGRRVTLSVGVAEFPGHGDDGERLVAAADDALYRAKEEGRNRVMRAVAAA